MARPARVNCKDCGRHTDECGSLSSRYLCGDCGERRLVANLTAMTVREGPYWERWRRETARAFERTAATL